MVMWTESLDGSCDHTNVFGPPHPHYQIKISIEGIILLGKYFIRIQYAWEKYLRDKE